MKRSRPSLRSAATSPRRKQQRKLLLEALEGRQMMAADVITGLAVFGDSYSDEYDPQPFTYASNWVELISERQVNVGAQATYPDDRGTGFEFNWSIDGGRVFDLNFNIFGLSSQIDAGQVSHGVIMFGMEEFGDTPVPSGETIYERIYSGAYSQSDIDFHFFGTRTQMGAMIDTLGATGGQFVFATIPDPGDTPDFRTRYPVAANRQKVTDVIQSVNAELRQKALDNNMPVLDLFAMQKALLGTHAAPIASQNIGGITFTAGPGATANATTLFTADGYHPHSAMQAVIANGVMTALNQGFGKNLQLYLENDIAGLTGQNFVSNTLNINYSSFVTVPDLSIVLDFGSTEFPSENDFAARIAELWNGSGAPGTGVGGSLGALTPAEIDQLRAGVLAQVQAAFSASAIGESNIRVHDYASLSQGMSMNVSKYHRVNLGLQTVPPADQGRNTIIGHFEQDWRNAQLNGAGYIAPQLLSDVLTNLTGMDRASRIQYVRNALSFYTVQGIGLSLGLSHADALGRPQITPANYAATGGVQNIDFMAGNEQLGFSIESLKSNVAFSFSPLAKAKLQMGVRTYDQIVLVDAETNIDHNTTANAQPFALQSVAGSSVKVDAVARASIAVAGQKDVYSFQASAGQLITLQTLLTQGAPATLNTVVRLLDSSGNQIAISDDTKLGFNSFDQNTGVVLQNSSSLVLNFPAPTTGTYYVEVSGSGNTVGEYDLFVATMPASTTSSPWTNPTDPLNVDNQPGIVPLDVLIIINELNNRQFSDADGRLRPPPVDKPPPYYDVNGDGFVIALDALIIINYLNRNQFVGGEGEQALSFAEEPQTQTAPTSEEGDPYSMAQWFWLSDRDDQE